jgi:UDP-2,3-diacylglucosamine hydrolase
MMRDSEFGIQHARSRAGLDIGQSIVVKSQTVVAVEAMEGTDAAILRAGEIAGEGVVLCKVAKPQQDNRFDVPVLGLTTVRKVAQAGGCAIAFPGREVLFFDLEAAVAEAEARRICILAV